MKHRIKGKKLNRTSSHRKALLMNMSNALIKHEQITTTLPKAKELRPYIEKVVTLGKKGDLFVMKSPASTIEDLVDGIGLLFNKKPKKKIIGIRHGEKMHETLVSAEEMIRAEDRGEYFRLLPDERDLNYDKYFTEGKEIKSSNIDVYDSSNTTMLSPKQVAERLKDLDFVKRYL